MVCIVHRVLRACCVLAAGVCAGEVFQMWTALGSLSGIPAKLTLTLLAIYLPGGPFMIMSMFKQRAGAYKKRAEQVCTCRACKFHGVLEDQ